MKLFLKIAGFGLLLLIIGYFGVRNWTAGVVKEHISFAQNKYNGSAEDALLSMLNDPSTLPNDKTHIAIWTLGQIRSEKALPVLRQLYENDPEGDSCYGKHNEVICQYELYKAIKSIEGEILFSFAYFNK